MQRVGKGRFRTGDRNARSGLDGCNDRCFHGRCHRELFKGRFYGFPVHPVPVLNAGTGEGAAVTYRVLLQNRELRGQLASVLIATVPLGMFPITIVLAVHSWTDSFAVAGWVSAAFTSGSAIGLTAQGHLIDRLGTRSTVVSATAVFVAASIAFVVVGEATAVRSVSALVALAAVAGASLPEITTAVRVWLARSALSSAQRLASYSLLGACFQTGLVFGPLLVTASVPWVGGTGTLVAITLLAIVAAGWFLRVTHPSATPSIATKAAGKGVPPDRAALHGPMMAILGVAAVVGAVGGVMTLVIPRLLAAAGSIELSGLLFASLAVGEVLGAVVYGMIRWPLGQVAQLVAVVAVTGLMLIACTLTTEVPWAFAILLFGIGAASGPVAVLLAAATEGAASSGAIGAASGVRISVSLLASAVGSALAGASGGIAGSSVVLGVLGSIVLVAAALPLSMRTVLRA